MLLIIVSSLSGINFCSVFELCAHIKTLRAPFVALRVIPVSTTTPPAAAGGSRGGGVGVAVAAHSTTHTHTPVLGAAAFIKFCCVCGGGEGRKEGGSLALTAGVACYFNKLQVESGERGQGKSRRQI